MSASSSQSTKKAKNIGPLMLLTLFVLINFVCVGHYFQFDTPQLLTEQLNLYFKITPLQVSYLYIMYSIPNYVAVPISGLLLSRYGVGPCILLFTSLVFIGASLNFIGVYTHTFWLLLVGRGVYGLGGEAIIISQYTMSEKWFAGKFLSFSIGINCFIDLLAVSLQDYVIPRGFIMSRNLEVPFFLISLAAFMGFMVSAVYYFIDIHAMFQNKICTSGNKNIRSERGQQQRERNMNRNKPLLKSALLLEKDRHSVEWDNRSSLILEKQNPKTSRSTTKVLVEMGEDYRPNLGFIRKPIFTFSHIDHLGTLYWLLVIIYTFLSMSYYQFINFMTAFLQKRFNYPYSSATDLVMVTQLLAAFMIPIFSVFVVFIGYKGFVLILSSSLSVASYTLFYNLPSQQGLLVVVGLVMISIQFSLYSSVIWSSMTLAVPSEATGIALALATCSQNVLLTILPIMFGYLNKEDTVRAYQNSLILLLVLAGISLVASVTVTIFDIFTGGTLHKSENDVTVLEIRERRSQVWRDSLTLNLDDLDLEGIE